MNRDESHMDQVKRWAYYVKNNPGKWKKEHTIFINALFSKREEFMKRLLSTSSGKEKYEKLRLLRLKKY